MIKNKTRKPGLEPGTFGLLNGLEVRRATIAPLSNTSRERKNHICTYSEGFLLKRSNNYVFILYAYS